MQLVPVIGVDCSIPKCSNCVLHKSRLIQCVGVDINLLSFVELMDEKHKLSQKAIDSLPMKK